MRALAVGLGLFALSCSDCPEREAKRTDLRGLTVDGSYAVTLKMPDGGFPEGSLVEGTLTVADGRATMVLATAANRYEIEMEMVRTDEIVEARQW